MALYVDPNKMQFIHGVFGVAFAAAKSVSLFLSQRKEKDGKQKTKFAAEYQVRQ